MPIGIMGGDSLSDSFSKKKEEGETRSHVLMLFPVTAGTPRASIIQGTVRVTPLPTIPFHMLRKVKRF